MSVLIYLKESEFSQWLSLSMAGFPVLIALHSVGMAVVVGMSLMVTLRLSGFITDIGAELLPRLLRIAVAGFVLNFLTGVALFITRGPEYLGSLMFLFKMLLVGIGTVILFRLQRRLGRRQRDETTILADGTSRSMSLVSTTVLFAAVVAGRLIAYLSDLY